MCIKANRANLSNYLYIDLDQNWILSLTSGPICESVVSMRHFAHTNHSYKLGFVMLCPVSKTVLLRPAQRIPASKMVRDILSCSGSAVEACTEDPGFKDG